MGKWETGLPAVLVEKHWLVVCAAWADMEEERFGD